MNLQAVTDVSSAPEVCLTYLALGGILLLGGVAGAVICTLLRSNPKADLTNNLISNAQALRYINNYQSANSATNTFSGHLNLGVLTAYIAKMQKACQTAGKEMTGLEYYFAKYGPTDEAPYQNRNTIVIYPTYNNGVGEVPFDPEHGLSVFDMNTTYQSDNGNASAMSAAKYTSMSALNRTHMSPPREPLTL